MINNTRRHYQHKHSEKFIIEQNIKKTVRHCTFGVITPPVPHDIACFTLSPQRFRKVNKPAVNTGKFEMSRSS